MNRLRVTRTIIIEGPEDWVMDTLSKSYLQPGASTFFLSGKRLEETDRKQEVVSDTRACSKDS